MINAPPTWTLFTFSGYSTGLQRETTACRLKDYLGELKQ